MDNKRFYCKDSVIYDANRPNESNGIHTFDLYNKVIILDWLNELNEEIEQLKEENIKLAVDNKELKCSNNELYQENERLKDENKQLKQELRFIQSELHNASLDVRERTLKEVSDAIEKIKRYE